MRTYLILGAAFLTALLSIFLTAFLLLKQSYIKIEDTHNAYIQQGLLYSLDQYLNRLRTVVIDYAAKDELQAFLKSKESAYLDRAFKNSSEVLKSLQVDFLQLLDENKTLIKALPKKDGISKALLSQKEKRSGFFVLNNNLYAFYNAKIKSPSKSQSALLQAVSRVDFKSLLLENKEIELIDLSFKKDLLKPRIEKLGDTQIELFVKKSPKSIQNYILFNDKTSEKRIGIKFTTSRSIYNQSIKNALILLTIIGLLISLLFGLILFRYLESKKHKNRSKEIVRKRTKKLQSTMHELKETVTKLEKIAYVDELTGVKTRRSFFETAAKWFENAKKDGKTLCFAMIDLDDFKVINDTYGHKAGDIVLKDFCRSCEKFLDENTVFGRLGGEEFVIGFYGVSIKNAQKVCEKIEAYIGEKLVHIEPKVKVAYTFSFGLACNDEAKDVDGVLRIADSRLYKAKGSSKSLIRSKKTPPRTSDD